MLISKIILVRFFAIVDSQTSFTLCLLRSRSRKLSKGRSRKNLGAGSRSWSRTFYLQLRNHPGKKFDVLL